jgi:hypothetical protein
MKFLAASLLAVSALALPQSAPASVQWMVLTVQSS